MDVERPSLKFKSEEKTMSIAPKAIGEMNMDDSLLVFDVRLCFDTLAYVSVTSKNECEGTNFD